MLKIALESLGCSKNLVDAEIMMGILNKRIQISRRFWGSRYNISKYLWIYRICKTRIYTNYIRISTIKETANLKLLIVTGCLAQRYAEELKTEIPEIDAIVGTGSYQQIDEIIANLEKENHIVSLNDIDFAYNEDLPRYVSTQIIWLI